LLKTLRGAFGLRCNLLVMLSGAFGVRSNIVPDA
jgi:hypothetical protein